MLFGRLPSGQAGSGTGQSRSGQNEPRAGSRTRGCTGFSATTDWGPAGRTGSIPHKFPATQDDVCLRVSDSLSRTGGVASSQFRYSREAVLSGIGPCRGLRTHRDRVLEKRPRQSLVADIRTCSLVGCSFPSARQVKPQCSPGGAQAVHPCPSRSWPGFHERAV